jgi:hypothetical protein
MSRSYTVIFHHPSGAIATFTYENGEMTALAQGLDASQFWIFKQVKAHLLRNEEDDLSIAIQMMAEQGFTAQVTNPLFTPVSSPSAPRPFLDKEEDTPQISYRTLPDYAISYSPTQTVSEIHWREHDVKPKLPPHKMPAVKVPSATTILAKDTKANNGDSYTDDTNKQQTVSEIHWRESERD